MTPKSARLRVAITGATGFVGRNLLARLPSTWQAVALVRSGSAPAGVSAAPFPDEREPLSSLLTTPFDVVVHLAGNSNHGLAEHAPWSDLDATARSAALVLGRVPTRRVVLLSSAAVYAGHVGLVNPDTAVRPLMAYALSKIYVEGFAAAQVASGVVETLATIRLYNAFGPGERSTRLIPRVAESVGAFALTGDPSSLSDPVHVDDVVQALIAAAESDVSGTFDLCGGDPVPLEQQIQRIAHALGRPPLRLEHQPRAGETPIRFYSDPASISTALGIPRPEPFESAVRRYGRAAGWMG